MQITPEPVDRLEPKPLQPFSFPAGVDPASVKYTRFGDCEIKLSIPREYREALVKLADTFGLVLLITVEPWQNPNVEVVDNA